MKKIFYLILTAVLCFGCTEGIEDENAHIYGTVVANGAPVNAAAVLLTPGGGTKITGSDGMYDFTDLEPGKYELKVYKEGFQSFNKSIEIKAGKNEELAITLSASAGKLSLNKAYIDMGSNEGNNVAGFSINNSGSTELTWQVTNAAKWISQIEPQNGTLAAMSSDAIIFTIDRSKLSSNSTDNHATLIVSSNVDGSVAELLVTVFGNDNGTNTTIDEDADYVVVGDLYVQAKDLGKDISWSSANSLCKNSILGGYDDWRLPTIDELATIYTQRNVIGGFQTKTNYYDENDNYINGATAYWSSTVYNSSSDYHYNLDFNTGNQDYYYSNNNFNARAVRKDVLPVVSIQPASNISESRITLNAIIENAGNPACTERGFVYATSHLPTTDNTKIISYMPLSSATFNETITGLSMNITYYVRAYATNKSGTVYSEELQVLISDQKAQVSTLPVNDITETSAVFHGTINSKGIPAYSERGFVYSTTFKNPTIEDVDNSVIMKKAVAGTSLGDFYANISDLTTGTTYYVCAYAANSEGTAYGQSVSFKPESPNYVILTATGIMVQKTDISTNTLSWSSANTLCESSTTGGYTDWRLPTKTELAAMYNERNAIGGFNSSSPHYWSSTEEYSYYNNYYWYVDFSSGASSYTSSSSAKWSRAVRTLP